MKYKTLKELCEVISDCPHSTPKWTDHGKIVVRNNNIKNGRIDLSSPSYTDEENFRQRIKRVIPQPGDLIITREAPMGEVGMIPEGIECCLGQRMVLLRANPQECDNYYLLYSIQSREVQHQISWSEGTGTTVSNLRIPHLEQLKIPYLPLKEQEKIVAILKSLDGKIELNNKINDNLEQQARLALNHWIEEHSEEYKMLPLSDVATVNDDTYAPKEQWPFVNYLDTSSITDGAVAELQYIVPSIDKLPSRAKRKITANDVVFSTVRPNQRHFGIIKLPVPNMLASTGFAVIRSKVKEICNELIYLRLTENSFIEAMQQLAEQSTSTFPSIKPSDLYQCEIPYPVDNKLTEILESMFSMIAANQKENAALSQLRDILLPKLMLGEIL